MAKTRPVAYLYTLRGTKSFSPTRLEHCIALGWQETPLYAEPDSSFADVALKNAQECGRLEIENIRLSTLVERMTRAVKASMIYFGSYVQDEAEEVECCISPEQHEAAVEMRESLLIAMAALTHPSQERL